MVCPLSRINRHLLEMCNRGSNPRALQPNQLRAAGSGFKGVGAVFGICYAHSKGGHLTGRTYVGAPKKNRLL